MPDPRRLRLAKLRIAVVAVTALSILGVLAYLLSGGTWLRAKAPLTTHIPDSTGLEADADVLLNGVKIGKVTSVQLTSSLDPNRVIEVGFAVEEHYLRDIPDDSRVGIDSANLLGDKYLDITMGKSPEHVRAGSELPFAAPSNVLQNIDLQQFDTQLRTIDQIIRDLQAGKGSLGQFVINDDLYRQFLAGTIRIEKQMRAAVGSQTQLGQMLYSAKMYDDWVASLKQLDGRIAQMQSNAFVHDPAQYDQIRDQLVKLRGALADLNAGKGAGGAFIVSDAAYTAWNKALASFIQTVDELNSGQGAMGHMLLTAETYESITGQLRQLQSTVKEFREDPRKFLRIKFKLF